MSGNSWGGSSQTLGYRGTRAMSPPNVTYNTRNPDQYDTKDVVLGDLWLNKSTEELWVLLSLEGTASSHGQLADWVLLSAGSGSVVSVTGNTGGAVGPDGSGNINILGSGNITVTGNAVTSTETITLIGTTNHSVQVGNVSGSLTSIAVGTTGQVLTGNTGADPSFQAPAASSITITGNSGGGLTGNSFTFTGGTTGLTFSGAGTTETLSGTLAIANGGTNATAMTNTNGVVYYDGTRLVTTTVGSAAQVLTSNGIGVAPAFQAAAAQSAIVTAYTTPGSGTHALNASTKSLEVYGWSGGSGGGSGRRGTDASSSGGGGGASDSFLLISPRSAFTSPVPYTVGAGGAGGAAQTVNDTNGNDGVEGGVTLFGGTSTSTVSTGKGIGGTNSTGTPGSGSATWMGIISTGSLGSSGSVTDAGDPVNITNGGFTGSGGGGGSGADSGTPRQAGASQGYVRGDGTVIVARSAGGISSGTINGSNGIAAAATNNIIIGGTGGGGGGGMVAGVAGLGGNGAFPGGSGGGGGGAINGTNSGAGGNGADGALYIIEYL